MSDEPIGHCTNCLKKLPESKIPLHEAYCFRNVKPCPKCKEMIDKKEQETHDLEVHVMKKCADCKRDFEAKFYNSHIEKCDMKPRQCNFCTLKIEKDKYPDHVYQCSSRTKVCSYCGKNVILRDYETHEASCILALSEQQNQELYQHPYQSEFPAKKSGSTHEKSSKPIQKEPQRQEIPVKERDPYQRNPVANLGYQKDPVGPSNYQKDLGNYNKDYGKDYGNVRKEQPYNQLPPSNNPSTQVKRDIKKQDSFTYKDASKEATKDPAPYGKRDSKEYKEYDKPSIPVKENLPSGIQKSNPYEIPKKEPEKTKPTTNAQPGKQYESYMQNKYWDKNKEKEPLYSQQALTGHNNNNKPISNPSQNNPYADAISKGTPNTNIREQGYKQPPYNTKLPDDKEKKPNTPGTHNFYEKKQSLDMNPTKPHMKDYDKEVPNKPNFNLNKKPEYDYNKPKIPETKSAGLGQNIPSKNNVPVNQKAAPTSYSNKAMGSQPQGNKPVQPKQEELSKNPIILTEQMLLDESLALRMQNELFENPNEYMNPNQKKPNTNPSNVDYRNQPRPRPPPKEENFDPAEYDPDLQEAIRRSNFKK